MGNKIVAEEVKTDKIIIGGSEYLNIPNGQIDLGNPNLLGAVYVDGTINTANSNITVIENVAQNYEKIKITITNENAIGCLISLWHIDDFVANLADDDILIPEMELSPNETYIYYIPVIETGHSLVVKSSMENVNFRIEGSIMISSAYKRLGSLFIDGTINTINEIHGVFTSEVDKKYSDVSIYLANIDNSNEAVYSLYSIDSNNIIDVQDNDVVISSDILRTNESFWNLDFINSLQANSTIAIKSNLNKINIIIYGKQV